MNRTLIPHTVMILILVALGQNFSTVILDLFLALRSCISSTSNIKIIKREKEREKEKHGNDLLDFYNI